MGIIGFTPSARGSIGLEWELALVERDTRGLSGRAPELLASLGATADGPVRGEYLASMVELVTGVHHTVPDAVAELRDLLARVDAAADALGLDLLAAGTHPFTAASGVPIVSSPQYDVVRRRNAWWGQRMIICGTHVHVGVPQRRLVMPLVRGLADLSPLVLALSASSPFFEGEDTGFASQRTLLFQQLPTNGLPPELATWADFEAWFEQVSAVGMVSRPSEVRWDVRPAPKFGTVELRVPDSSPTLAELACVAAWTQCLTEFVLDAELDGRPLTPLAPWFVRENKWRAARYGLDAALITDGHEAVLRDVIPAWLERLEPLAVRLGCRDDLVHAEVILADGASYERQRAVVASGGDLVAVVDALVAETKGSR